MRDSQMFFSNAQAITAAAQSTNVVDLADANHQIGWAVKQPLLRVRINTTFSGSLTSLTFALQDSAASGSGFADTEIKILSVAKAKLTAGTDILNVPLPVTGGPGQIGSGQYPNASPLRRFIAVQYTPNGGNAAAGKVDAWLDVE